jgi:hypothetical protein
MASRIPPAKAVRDLLEGLLGRDVNVALSNPPEVATSAALGLYVSDTHRMTAVVSMDLRLAAYAGTSIALIPPGGAEVVIDDGILPDAVFANVGEVFNVFASVLNENSDVHQRLFASYRGAVQAPPDAQALLAAIGNRLDLKVQVQKYGTGVLSCVLVP